MIESELDHEDLRVYRAAIGFVAWLEDEISGIANNLSASEHLARASGGIPVNIAQASGKRSANERRQYIDTAYGSSLECAACLDVMGVLANLHAENVDGGKERLATLVSMLIGFRKSAGMQMREDGAEYVAVGIDDARVWFDHERLDVYQMALNLVVWYGKLGDDPEALPRTAAKSLDRASTSVVLNIAEGNGKFSIKDRCRFISHARTAALQLAAIIDVLAARKVESIMRYGPEGKRCLANIVRMLIGWERSLEKR